MSHVISRKDDEDGIGGGGLEKRIMRRGGRKSFEGWFGRRGERNAENHESISLKILPSRPKKSFDHGKPCQFLYQARPIGTTDE